MANFSKKERLIASALSATPGLKRVVKRCYVRLNALIYKKTYSQKLLSPLLSDLTSLPVDGSEESFFGYYDKCPSNGKGQVICYTTNHPTSKKPSADKSISLMVIDTLNGECTIIDTLHCYNWQQGARAQWLSDDLVIYNQFEGGKYVAKVFSVSTKKISRSYTYSMQDSRKDCFLSINYERIMALRPDYGYRNLPALSMETLKAREPEDGIWKVSLRTGRSELIHSLTNIIGCEPQTVFAKANHKVNHVMFNADGSKFIFIHRYYLNGVRFDRLMCSDSNKLTVLADDQMVSHCCWVNNNTVFGYLRHQGVAGFYFINVDTHEVSACTELNEINNGDGHPSCVGDYILFDSYPDKSRMQHLTLYNIKSHEITPLLEVYQDVKYDGECRCDLHPRLSPRLDGLYFDSVYSGKRRLCYAKLNLKQHS